MTFKLYAFGSNGSGQLGLGHTEDVSRPTACDIDGGPLDQRPVKVAAGGNHTLVACADSSLWAAGANDDGRLGVLTDQATVKQLTRVVLTVDDARTVDRFKLFAATWEASIFVTNDGEVYSCGSGAKGELGQGNGVVLSRRPRRITGFPPSGTAVVDIASCAGHVVAVLSDGQVFGWGNGRKGQLGDRAEAVAWSPSPVHGVPFAALHVQCGREFSMIVASAETRRYIVLGSDKWQVISAGPVELPLWQSFSASWCGLYVLDRDGALLSWGRNDRGQLPSRPADGLTKIVAGSEHAVVETKNGKILAWGWGEHGNCGPSKAEDGDNEIQSANSPATGALRVLGAGCATSWLVSDEIEESVP